MIQVVNRALDIIEFVAGSGKNNVTLKEISSNLKLNAGTCANIIKTLTTRDYLVKDIESGRGYGLGTMAYSIAGDQSYSIDIINASKEAMNHLTATIYESCMIGILRNNVRVSLYEVHADQELRVINKKEKPAYQAASGRVLLANLMKEKLNHFINLYGVPKAVEWKGVQSVATLKKELEIIHNQSYGIQVAESGILGVAVPVYQKHVVVASLGVFLPSTRFNEKIKNNILKQLWNVATKISYELDAAKKSRIN